ncbi:hypothetical protein WJX82_009314 [Trebouxia sp. C0006]
MSEQIPFLRSRYGAAAVASAALAAAAAAWYTAKSPITEVSPEDNSTANPSGLLAPVRFKVPLRQADGTFPPSLYGWAANVQSRMSGTLEDVEDEQQAISSLQTQPASDATRASSSGRKSAHQVAAEHQQEVAILQELLKKQGLSTLPLRLNSGDPELIRYAIAAGAFREQEKSSALQRAALSIQATAVWLAEHKFLSREEMQQYKNLVWWEDLDSQNRPILMVRLGQALNECKSRAEADRVAECIVSQINYGVLNFMDDQQGPEKLVVILDCRGASAFQASKLVRLMKSVAVTLNQHYPSRLQQLFFVEPPAVMKWPIQAAKPLLHADTGNKIQVVCTMVVQGWGSLQANHLSTWCVVGAGQCMAWQVRHMDTADRAMREEHFNASEDVPSPVWTWGIPSDPQYGSSNISQRFSWQAAFADAAVRQAAQQMRQRPTRPKELHTYDCLSAAAFNLLHRDSL